MHRNGGSYLPARLAFLSAGRYPVGHLTERPRYMAERPNNVDRVDGLRFMREAGPS